MESTVIEVLETQENLENINIRNTQAKKALFTKNVIDVIKAVLFSFAAILSNLVFILLLIKEYNLEVCCSRSGILNKITCLWGQKIIPISYCISLFVGLYIWVKDDRKKKNVYLAKICFLGIFYTLFILYYKRVLMKYYDVDIDQFN